MTKFGISLLVIASALTCFQTVKAQDAISKTQPDVLAAKALYNHRNTPDSIKSVIGMTDGELVETRRHVGKFGVTHTRYQQRLNGLRVYGTEVKVATETNGNLKKVMSRTTARKGKQKRSAELQIRGAKLTEKQAINRAIKENFGGAKPAIFFMSPPKTERVYFETENGLMQEGYIVENWSKNDNMLYSTLVDGHTGEIIKNNLLTNHATGTYRIYPESPLTPAPTFQQNLSEPINATASPNGWLNPITINLGPFGSFSYNLLNNVFGNNATVYLDKDGNGIPDLAPSGYTFTNDFLTQHNSSQAPTAGQNPLVSVQNAFYHVNKIHDELYGHGFTEPAGNFQIKNFGKGGVGGDPVIVRAQFGADVTTGGAIMSTPTADGGSPTMHLYVSSASRDVALDSDVIWHEYGHGLMERMVGGMSDNKITRAVGEGMGDVLAIYKNNDDLVGEYQDNDYVKGIRSARYHNYARTLDDFEGGFGVFNPHKNGEIYAATLWNLRARLINKGLASDTIMDYIVNGLNYTPSSPTFLTMRDGLIEATPQLYKCDVWESFAEFGMGTGAIMNQFLTIVNTTESNLVPASCNSTSLAVQNLTGNKTPLPFGAGILAIVTIDVGGSGVTVSGNWSNISGAKTCITGGNGTCSIHQLLTAPILLNFTVNTLNGSSAQGSPLTVSF